MRSAWLRVLCRLAEEHGSELCEVHPARGGAAAAATRAAAPTMAVLGGRTGAPRSLGSVLGAAVARFLPRGFQCVLRAVVAPLDRVCTVQHLAVSPDGAVLYRSLWAHHVVEARRVTDGELLHEAAHNRVRRPEQLAVTRDGRVLVAEFSNDRIQVMTPQLRLVRYLGVGVLHGPAGVCVVVDADDDDDAQAVVIVAGERRGRMVTFAADGRVLHSWTVASDRVTCVVALPSCVAVASRRGNIHMFRVDGTFVRSVAIDDAPGRGAHSCSSTDAMAYDGDAEELLVVTGAVFAAVDCSNNDTVRKFPQRLWGFGIAACRGTVYTCTFHTPALIALQ